MKTVAFQGEPGAYSERAVYQFFDSTIKSQPCKDFREVFESVNKQKVTAGVVPVENSIEGSVNQNYDLFFDYNLKVRGEVIVRIEHCLIVNPNTNIDQIQAVYSHPQALAQCHKYLENQRWEIIPTYDTAGSVKIIKEQKKLNAAAIASERAAQIYGMQILSRNIADNKENYTRFFVIDHEDAKFTGTDKTSIIFSAKHEPGSLYKALGEFAGRNINLTKIESRPTKKTAWEYNFYLDFEGHRTEQKCKEALLALEKHSMFVKVLGSYPKAA